MTKLINNFRENEKYSVILIFSLAFVIRATFSVFSYNSDIMTGFVDDLGYMKKAEILLTEGLFNWQNPDLNMPGLPFLMALAMSVFGKNWLVVFLVNSFIGAITPVIIFKTGKIVFNWKIGFSAAIWSIFYILFLKYIPTAGKEPWMILLFSLIIYLISRLQFYSEMDNKGRVYTIILIALLYSFFIHFDERYLSWLPLIILFLFSSKKLKKIKNIRVVSLFLVILLITMLPWLIRNYKVYDKVVILSKRTEHLTDKLFGYEEANYIMDGKKKSWYLTPAQIDSVINGTKTTLDSGLPILPQQVNAMRIGNLPHEFSRLERYFSTFVVFWKPIDFYEGYSTYGYRFDGRWSVKHNLSVGLTYGPVLLLSIFALVILFRKKHYFAYFALAIFGWHTIIHVLFIPFARNRYRIPVDGLIIILGMYGLFYLIDYLRRERKAALKA